MLELSKRGCLSTGRSRFRIRTSLPQLEPISGARKRASASAARRWTSAQFLSEGCRFRLTVLQHSLRRSPRGVKDASGAYLATHAWRAACTEELAGSRVRQQRARPCTCGKLSSECVCRARGTHSLLRTMPIDRIDARTIFVHGARARPSIRGMHKSRCQGLGRLAQAQVWFPSEGEAAASDEMTEARSDCMFCPAAVAQTASGKRQSRAASTAARLPMHLWLLAEAMLTASRSLCVEVSASAPFLRQVAAKVSSYACIRRWRRARASTAAARDLHRARAARLFCMCRQGGTRLAQRAPRINEERRRDAAMRPRVGPPWHAVVSAACRSTARERGWRVRGCLLAAAHA